MNKKQPTKYFTKPKDYLIAILGIISAIYLLNFSFGFIEFLPDALPIVGNLDEVFMVGMLASSLSYFGINMPSLFKRKN